jgi:hypothetical protein
MIFIAIIISISSFVGCSMVCKIEETSQVLNPMPVIHIDIPNKEVITDNETYLECNISLSDCDEQFELRDEAAGIRLRGNSTLTFDKKSYRIKFNEKKNLLGQGKGAAKSWVLLANHCDFSLLRNYLAYQLGNELNGIEWTSSATFVELYLNGSYLGVYLLCDQVQVHETRINIDTQAENGFLIELDKWALNDGSEEGKDYFVVNQLPYTVKSVEESIDIENKRRQFASMKEYIGRVKDAIYSHKRQEIEKLIDLDSCVDMYILLELFKNIDAGWSLYLYKNPGGKLFFGPPWDFDTAAGNDYRLDVEEYEDQYEYPYQHDYEGLYVGGTVEDPQRVINGWSYSEYYGNDDYNFQQRNDWYIELMSCDWFRVMVNQRYKAIDDNLEDMLASIDLVTEQYGSYFEDNFRQWKVWGTRIHMTPKALMEINSQKEQAEYLKIWLQYRIEWLAECFEELSQ